jgi:hypothetical protein
MRRCPMSVTFAKESKNLIVLNLKGTFTFEDLKEIENKAHAEIIQSQKIKVLVLAEQFSEWSKDGDWGDLTFMFEHDPYIEKIAVVAESKWREQILMFVGAGRRQASVEFFLPDETQGAREWLQNRSE